MNNNNGPIWRRVKLVGQPYWFGPEMHWSLWTILAALAISGAIVFTLTISVSAAANLIVSWFQTFQPATVVSAFQTYGPYGGATFLALLLLGGFHVWRNQKAPLVLPANDTSGSRTTAWVLLFTVLAFMFSVNVLNVIINKISGTFTTALNDKQELIYWAYMYLYACIFVVGTPIVVFNSFFRRVLFVHWRRWLTHYLLDKYLGGDRAFYRINGRSDIDNPDERIHQDVQNFVDGALSLMLTFLGALMTLVSFFGILWSMSQLLTWSVIGYAAFGTLVTVFFGRIMVGLNGLQLRYEADFRFGITHVRNNAESIAFYHGEKREKEHIRQGFRYVFWNFVRLLAAQRNLSFFTQGFEYAVIIIPALFLAPMYFHGDIKVGVITMATMAFRQILSSLAVIVESFPSITLFAANTHRLGAFVEALDNTNPNGEVEQIVIQQGDKIKVDNLTLKIPGTGRVLAANMSFEVESNQPLLIVGPSGCGKSTILRALGGLWPTGSGTISLPVNLAEVFTGKEMMFLPQNPHMIRGTLRDQLIYPNLDASIGTEALQEVLAEVNLNDLDKNFANGFEEYRLLWKDTLSQGQQQRVALARLLLTGPKVAILDEASSALDAKNEARLYQTLRDRGILYVSVGHRLALVKYHAKVLELKGDGGWELMSSEEYARRQAEEAQ